MGTELPLAEGSIGLTGREGEGGWEGGEKEANGD